MRVLKKTVGLSGLTIQYNIQYRNGGRNKTYVLQIVEPQDDRLKKKLPIRRNNDTDDQADGCPTDIIEQYLVRLLKHLEKEGQDIYLILHDHGCLTLRLAWLLGRKEIYEVLSCNADGQREVASVMQWLIEDCAFGDLNLSSFRPGLLTEKLSDLSTHRRKACLRAIRHCYENAIRHGVNISNQWANYRPSSIIDRQRADNLIRKHNTDTMLSNAQMARLLQRAIHGVQETGDPRYFGLVLWCSYYLDFAEICALDYKYIVVTPYYEDRVTVYVHQRYARQGNNVRCTLVPVGAYQERYLTLSRVETQLYRCISTGADDDPLIPHPHNKHRRQQPESYERWVAAQWEELFEGEEALPWTKHRSLLYNTVTRNLKYYGMDNDSLDYSLSRAAKGVDAKNYCGYADAVMQVSMAAVHDRWVEAYYAEEHGSIGRTSERMTRSGAELVCGVETGKTCAAQFAITVPPLDVSDGRGIEMMLYSYSEMDITINWETDP